MLSKVSGVALPLAHRAPKAPFQSSVSPASLLSQQLSADTPGQSPNMFACIICVWFQVWTTGSRMVVCGRSPPPTLCAVGAACLQQEEAKDSLDVSLTIGQGRKPLCRRCQVRTQVGNIARITYAQADVLAEKAVS